MGKFNVSAPTAEQGGGNEQRKAEVSIHGLASYTERASSLPVAFFSPSIQGHPL
jgi:hypothetical protein